MKTYGCCRISRKDQNIERQERNIRALYPDAIIIRETYTGTKIEGRKEFEKLLRIIKAGDRIVFDSVSRMSRNAQEGVGVYKDLFCRGVELVFLKEPHINTETYKSALDRQMALPSDCGNQAANELIESITAAINRYTLRLAEQQIVIAFEQAEKEVLDLRQRTREGIETARLAGKQIGAAPGAKFHVKKADTSKKLIKKYSRDFDGSLTDQEAIKLIGIASNTYYKYKREMREVLNNV